MSLCHPRQRCFRLGQPGGHVRTAVETDGEDSAAHLLPLAGYDVQGDSDKDPRCP